MQTAQHTTMPPMMGASSQGMSNMMGMEKCGMMPMTGMMGMPMMPMMTGTKLEECAKMCMETAAMINKTTMYCMNMMKADQQTMEMLNMLTDCKEVLCVASDFMMRGSMCHSMMCSCCMQICEKCCSMMDTMCQNDKMMKMCCDMMRQCCQMCKDTCMDTNGAKAQEYKQKIMECCQ